MPIDSKRVQAIFLVAVEQADRAAILDRECGNDLELRRRVEALLKAHDEPASYLDQPAVELAELNRTIDEPPITERPGTMIGPYKLKEQIGEGGFGLVFVAEQQEPVRRKVALKVIKPGMDTREVMARFAAERQALALMDHPNIARVLDAGATDSGRPYFVMELVRGIPITEYCDQNQLSPRDRLDLFITVCQAVQHAHQKGIIHRDIKPSNVLVTSHDGKPVAKVIDFGVAKAINQQLTERSIYTNFTQMIGTPLYMSPEQAEMSGLDIDTRSDIYSLGVLLYELLTGTTPLEKKKFAKAAYDEIRRMIREEEPQKPSTRLSTSDSIASIAAQRHMEPARLSKLMRGDLDWITMKALEKDALEQFGNHRAHGRNRRIAEPDGVKGGSLQSRGVFDTDELLGITVDDAHKWSGRLGIAVRFQRHEHDVVPQAWRSARLPAFDLAPQALGRCNFHDVRPRPIRPADFHQEDGILGTRPIADILVLNDDRRGRWECGLKGSIKIGQKSVEGWRAVMGSAFCKCLLQTASGTDSPKDHGHGSASWIGCHRRPFYTSPASAEHPPQFLRVEVFDYVDGSRRDRLLRSLEELYSCLQLRLNRFGYASRPLYARLMQPTRTTGPRKLVWQCLH